MKCQASPTASLDPSLDPTSRHQIKPSISDRAKGRREALKRQHNCTGRH
jgi:hypothetical protein